MRAVRIDCASHSCLWAPCLSPSLLFFRNRASPLWIPEQTGLPHRPIIIKTTKKVMYMKKYVRLTIMTLMVLITAAAITVQAEIFPPRGMGQIGYDAVVLCENLTVRQEPSASSKAVQTLHSGKVFMVTQQTDGWAECILSDSLDAAPVGWVSTEYILIDPAWYRTDEKTPVYAWNDTGAPKVALLDKDTSLPILKDEGDWLIVSLRGATGWIQRNAAD